MDDPKGYGFAFENLQNQPFCALLRNFLPGFKSTHHRHDFVQIWYCYKGAYFHQVGAQTYECSAGSMIILPVGTPHQFWIEEDTDLMYINIHYNLLLQAKPQKHKHAIANLLMPAFEDELNFSFSIYRNLPAESRKTFEQAFSWLSLMNYAPLDSAKESLLWDKLEEIFSAEECAISCENRKKVTHIVQSKIVPILKIVSYLNNHYPEKITNEMLLREGNISRTAMCRHFKQFLKTTPSQYLQSLRVRHAHICLRDTIYSLQEIAELCGFYDVYHLSHLYSKNMGKTISSQRACIEEHRRKTLNIE